MDRKGYFSVRQDYDKHPLPVLAIMFHDQISSRLHFLDVCHLADAILGVELQALELARIVSNT